MKRKNFKIRFFFKSNERLRMQQKEKTEVSCENWRCENWGFERLDPYSKSPFNNENLSPCTPYHQKHPSNSVPQPGHLL